MCCVLKVLPVLWLLEMVKPGFPNDQACVNTPPPPAPSLSPFHRRIFGSSRLVFATVLCGMHVCTAPFVHVNSH